jgi:hypothetical protein
VLLKILNEAEKNDFKWLVTGDESWFILEYQHSHQWAMSIDETNPNVK